MTSEHGALTIPRLRDLLSLCALVGLVGCAGSSAPIADSEGETSADAAPGPETAVTPASPACGWIHLPIVAAAHPDDLREPGNLALFDELLATLRARPDLRRLRIEARGCYGERPELTLARAEGVRALFVERGVPADMLSTSGYPSGTRGCQCPCELLEDPPADEKASPPKNCATGLDACRPRRPQMLTVEFSVADCDTPE